MRFRWLLGVVVTTLVASGCGGSSHSRSADGGAGASQGAASASSTTASGSAPGRGSAGGNHAPAPGNQGGVPAGGSGGGATHARVPATYVIRGGKVSPPAISVPAFLAIQLTAVSADGKGHRVTLQARSGVTLNVPAGGRASQLVPGLPSAQYKLQVDGVARGTLMTGGEPGP